MKLRSSAAFALALTLGAGSARAHHSFALFDLTKRVMLTGTLTKVDWRNPHVQISIDVKGDQGQTESWSMESDAPGNLKERGITKDRFQNAVGQIVRDVPESHLCPRATRRPHPPTARASGSRLHH